VDDTPRRRVGRPRLRDGEPTQRIQLQLPASDYDRVTKVAVHHRVSVQTVVRRAIGMALKRDPPPVDRDP
jgi:hypothetical protein